MAQVNISLLNLYQKAFGKNVSFDNSKFIADSISEGTVFDSQTYFMSGGIASEQYDGFDNILNESEVGDFVNVRDSLKGNYLGRALFMPVKIRNLQLPNEPLLVISGKKTIIKTSLAGSQKMGTVKELISTDDYEITIRGIAINPDSKLTYPEDQVKAIHELYLMNEAHFIECGLTSLLGIDKLVIEAITFPEMVGVQHAQAYELKCISDNDFELIL